VSVTQHAEFKDEESTLEAIELTGQKLKGVPIIAQLTEAEKNHAARPSSTPSQLYLRLHSITPVECSRCCELVLRKNVYGQHPRSFTRLHLSTHRIPRTMATVNDVAALLDETACDVEKSPDSQNQFEDRTFEEDNVTKIDPELFTRPVGRNNQNTQGPRQQGEDGVALYNILSQSG
jgi:hypothetical protein